MLFSGFFQSDFVMLSLVYAELFSDFVAVLWSDTCKIFFFTCSNPEHYKEVFI